MIKSMTGFGKTTVEVNNKKIIIEIKSLNSKQFDMNLRMPPLYREKEMEVRALVKEQLDRGKIDMIIYFDNAETGKKNTIKVFDRIFYYPLIKPSMVNVYSYYWGLSNMEQYREKCTVDLDTVANTLGMSRATVKRLLEQMSDLGLLEVQENKYRKNAPHVKLLVDFSKEQPEETEYLAEKKREYEEAIERWVQEQEQKEREMGLLEELDELDEWEREMKKPPLSWDEDEEFPF